ncbi:hypothetical protein AB6A40_000370 [Gnathostoma spinigerum]|uniref:Uncharacterized protein n=1 Tax=Gnathostoma spinigerum TaxID=75299 RepID=A0ABD6E8I3_9BILA
MAMLSTLLAKCREAALLKEDDMIARQNELEQMCRSQQLEYAHLASKLADLESANEQLINDKKRLEQTLCKDTNSKVAKLSEEIRSLNAALEMKSTEMRELRHLNATLQLKLEVVPMKDIEISKLKHRVQELKAVVDQKLITERVLTSKYEELQKSARYQAEVSESMLKENDILRYKIEEMESTSENETPSNVTKYYTPVSSRSSVRFRNSDSRGEGRPASCIVQSRVCHSARGETGTQRNSTEESPLSKSVVSMYLENGRSRSSNRNIDTIYTPEGTFIAHGTGKSRKLSFSSCDQPDLSPAVLQTNGENSSGGADGDRTVMDSGISI